MGGSVFYDTTSIMLTEVHGIHHLLLFRTFTAHMPTDINIILSILEATVAAQPHSTFAQSLLHQYRERGSLSKKQLEGLYGKAQKVPGIPQSKLATLEAVILKKHAKHKSEKPVNKPMFVKDEKAGELIAAILQKYPQHKRVLFLQNKYNNNETITAVEITELEKFHKLLLK